MRGQEARDGAGAGAGGIARVEEVPEHRAAGDRPRVEVRPVGEIGLDDAEVASLRVEQQARGARLLGEEGLHRAADPPGAGEDDRALHGDAGLREQRVVVAIPVVRVDDVPLRRARRRPREERRLARPVRGVGVARERALAEVEGRSALEDEGGLAGLGQVDVEGRDRDLEAVRAERVRDRRDDGLLRGRSGAVRDGRERRDARADARAVHEALDPRGAGGVRRARARRHGDGEGERRGGGAATGQFRSEGPGREARAAVFPRPTQSPATR